MQAATPRWLLAECLLPTPFTHYATRTTHYAIPNETHPHLTHPDSDQLLYPIYTYAYPNHPITQSLNLHPRTKNRSTDARRIRRHDVDA